MPKNNVVTNPILTSDFSFSAEVVNGSGCKELSTKVESNTRSLDSLHVKMDLLLGNHFLRYFYLIS